MKIILLSAFLFCVLSCSQPTSVPLNILPPDRMQAIMWDAMRADELAAFYSYKDTSYKTIAKHDSLYQAIFDLHKITRAEFRNSILYYQNHPDLLKIAIDSMQKQLDMSIRKNADTIKMKGMPKP